MTDKFQPPPEQLPPLADLIALADVTEEDAEAAAQKWKENPPGDEDFKLILEAKDTDG